jgi:meiotically up-regulated gene 157 (Mug157) protein
VGFGWIWPMSVVVRALTSTDDVRQVNVCSRVALSSFVYRAKSCSVWLRSRHPQLVRSHRDAKHNVLTRGLGTGFLHESFWQHDAGSYTRPWFAWVNALFGELILTLAREKPYLIF